MNEKIATKLMMAKRLKTETEKECKDASSREIGTTGKKIAQINARNIFK